MSPSNRYFGGNKSPKSQGIYLAQRFRTEHRLAPGPVERIEQLTELVAADLLITDLPKGVSALTVCDPSSGNIVIGVTTSDAPYRQNFSLAHEVGHVYAGDLDSTTAVDPCLNADGEKRADSFAAHVLCPPESLSDQLEGRDPTTEEALSHIVQRFKVSPRAALNQLRRAKLISPDRARELGSARWTAPALASRFGWRDAYDAEVARASFPRPAPRIVADATQAYLDGTVSAEAVALARGISLEQVHRELDGFIPSPPSTEAKRDPFAALDDFFGED